LFYWFISLGVKKSLLRMPSPEIEREMSQTGQMLDLLAIKIQGPRYCTESIHSLTFPRKHQGQTARAVGEALKS
jgi:hypothetical protein